MKILYISAMFDEKLCSKYFNKNKKPMIAASKYHRLLCEGLARNGIQVDSYSSIPINKELCDKSIILIPTVEKDNIKNEYITTFNINKLKNIYNFIASFFKALRSNNNTLVIYDPLVVSSSLGIIAGSLIRGIKCIGVVTDLPEFMPISKNKFFLKINNILMQAADGYIFLTAQMNDAVNLSKKPYVVLEGHADSRMGDKSHAPFNNDNRVIVYAGSLMKIYGIENLCEAFIKCNFNNVSLHIFGDGDFREELIEITKRHSSIIYHGNRPNSEVVDMELKATLLVNPRPAKDEYTKYSFPSKTLEYMASGTPVLTSKLPGIPTDYDEYLYFFDDSDEYALEKALRSIMKKDKKELEVQGKKARDFALNYKNNIIQAKKIKDFLLDKFFLKSGV